MVTINFIPEETNQIDFIPDEPVSSPLSDLGPLSSIINAYRGLKALPSQIDAIAEQRKAPTAFESSDMGEKLPSLQKGNILGYGTRVAGEIGEMLSGLGQLPSQMLPQKIPTSLSEFGQQLRQPFDIIGQILSQGSLQTIATLAHPVASFQGRPLSSALDLLQILAIGKMVKGMSPAKVVSSAAKEIGPSATAKFLSNTLGMPEDDLIKVTTNPKKYVKAPLSKFDELKEVDSITSNVVKNIDELTDFKMRTVEDTVAKNMSTIGKRFINSSDIKSAITKEIMTMMDEGVIDKPRGKFMLPKKGPIPRLIQLIDERVEKRYDGLTGRYGNTITFEEAHKLKQDIYRLNKKNYGVGNFTDVDSRIYKVAAKAINDKLRALSNLYADANDAVKSVYDLSEQLGSRGFEYLEGIGAEKRIRAMFTSPSGRRFLGELEQILPEEGRFLDRLTDLEETQRIRKQMRSVTTNNPLAPTAIGAGSVLGYRLGGWPGGIVGGTLASIPFVPKVASSYISTSKSILDSLNAIKNIAKITGKVGAKLGESDIARGAYITSKIKKKEKNPPYVE